MTEHEIVDLRLPHRSFQEIEGFIYPSGCCVGPSKRGSYARDVDREPSVIAECQYWLERLDCIVEIATNKVHAPDAQAGKNQFLRPIYLSGKVVCHLGKHRGFIEP